LDIFGWFEFLDLDTHHLDSPFAGFSIERLEELSIDGLTIGEGLIECHGSEDTTETRLGEIDDRHEDIGYLVLSLDRIGDLDVDDPVDRDSDIISRDNLLFRDRDYLLTDVELAERLDPWDEEYNPRTHRIGISTEKLSESKFSLRNFLHKHRYDDCEYDE